ncbi:MAG: DUF2237 domain-containing protein [Dermatophilaceae bacterium]
MAVLNVFGAELQPCSTDPLTGFFRDGSCIMGSQALGGHTVCVVATEDFLRHQVATGNDLVTPAPHFAFPGLRPGDSWCVLAARWRQAYEDGCASPVRLQATNILALQVVPQEWLIQHAVDAPDDLSELLDPPT